LTGEEENENCVTLPLAEENIMIQVDFNKFHLNLVAYLATDFSLTAVTFQRLIFVVTSCDDDLNGYSNKVKNIMRLSH
jgi:hypothetical protein